MTAVSDVFKLAELRAKTDHDLVCLVSNAITLGIQCASAANGVGGPLHERAEEIYADVLMLLPKIETAAERRRVEKNIGDLRALLHSATKARAASCATC